MVRQALASAEGHNRDRLRTRGVRINGRLRGAVAASNAVIARAFLYSGGPGHEGGEQSDGTNT
jgi:hypothetical protein